jgi:hypothetical protein
VLLLLFMNGACHQPIIDTLSAHNPNRRKKQEEASYNRAHLETFSFCCVACHSTVQCSTLREYPLASKWFVNSQFHRI